MSDDTHNHLNGVGFWQLLTLLFIALKLTGHIDWPWLVVTSPMLVGIIVYVIVALCLELAKSK